MSVPAYMSVPIGTYGKGVFADLVEFAKFAVAIEWTILK